MALSERFLPQPDLQRSSWGLLKNLTSPFDRPRTAEEKGGGTKTVPRLLIANRTRTGGVLIVSYLEYPGAFGLSRRIQGIRLALSENDILSDIICPVPRMISGDRPVNLSQSFSARLYESSLGRAVALILFSVLAIPAIISHSQRKGFLIQYESLYSAFPAIVAKTVLRKKIIGDEVILMSPGTPAPLRYLLRALDYALIRMTDYITTSSVSSHAQIRRWFPTKPAYVVPNGVMPALREGARFLDMKELVFVGSLSSLGNRIAVENILRLAEILELKSVKFHIYIVGGPLRFALPYLRHRTVSRGRVTFLGILDDEELSVLLGKVSVGLLPFFSPSHGGQRIKGLDYLAHGLLVVSGPYGFGWLPGIVDKTHFLEAEDLEEMSEIVKRCISDPTFYSWIAATGREFVDREFSWLAVSKPYLNVVRGLMEMPGGAHVN